MHSRDHLRRLANTWERHPVYFLTACAVDRRKILTSEIVARELTASLHTARIAQEWSVGRYVIMPDHIHFFAQASSNRKNLSEFMRDWKKWTTHQIRAATHDKIAVVWQPEFFDHVLRSQESYAEKWAYVRENPVRAGLVSTAEDWPYAGECEIFHL